VGGSIQTPAPTYVRGASGYVALVFKFYGTGATYTSMDITKNVAQLAKGYVTLTNSGTNKLNAAIGFQTDGYRPLTDTSTFTIGGITYGGAEFWRVSLSPSNTHGGTGYTPPSACPDSPYSGE
jgi:hypothetical protein